MKSKNKQFNLAVLIGIISVLISIELPYSDKALIQLLLPNMKVAVGDEKLLIAMLAGLIPIAGLVLCFVLIIRSKRFNANRFLIFLVMLLIILPLLSNELNFIKAPVYMLSNGAGSIEITDSKMSETQIEKDRYLQLEIKMRGYDKAYDDVKIALRLPDRYDQLLEETYFEFNDYLPFSQYREITMTKLIKLKDNDSSSDFSGLAKMIYHTDYVITITDSTHEVNNTRNDSY